MGKIKVLDDVLAKKIAAGEVIERPASVLRELLDNSIDSGALNIIVDIVGGGIDKIRVADDGSGMDGDDLKLSVLTHATSKLSSEQDLFNLHTLGFRGEALASIGVCSKLEITSVAVVEEAEDTKDNQKEKSKDSDLGAAGHRLTVHAGNVVSFEDVNIPRGTIVESRDLFYSLPARRNFLKRATSEASQCKKTFLEKALAFPNVTFKYFNDGKPTLILPSGTREDRLLGSFRNELNPKLIRTIKAEMDHYSIEIVAALPELSQKSRRLMQVYVNNRRIEEFSLTHAAEIGYADYLPGGLFPICFIFITIDPSRVDFNVHPAKREAKFRDLRAMHHTISRAIKDFLLAEKGLSEKAVDGAFAQSLFHRDQESLPQEPSHTKDSYQASSNHFEAKDSYRNTFSENSSGGGRRVGGSVSLSGERALSQDLNRSYRSEPFPVGELAQNASEDSLGSGPYREKKQESHNTDFHYLGRLFECYLLTERNGTLYIVDQHAAHERVLYDEFVKREPTIQPLLIPMDLEVSREESLLIEDNLENYRELGICLQRKESDLKDDVCDWEVTALPREAVEYKNDILSLLRLEKGSFDEMKKAFFANMACKAAVKDGYELDHLAAVELLKKSFKLEFPRCPHGRPIWFALTEEELRRLVGRDV